MSEEQNKAQAAAAIAHEVAEAPAAAPKAAVKKPVVKNAAGKAVGVKLVAPVAPAAEMATAKPPAARKRSLVDETVDRHQKALADALVQAQAIKYDKPKHLKQPAKAAKAEPAPKAKKTKLVRDSFAMPEAEYARIGELKKRLGGAFKKSELLRAGVLVLVALNDVELKAVMGRVERIKTGRPPKK
jgi:hypothetical protein